MATMAVQQQAFHSGFVSMQAEQAAPTQRTSRRPGDAHQAELLQAARMGDLAAFNQLVLLHQDSLFRWALSLVKDEAQAEDITQATFISAYQKLHGFRGESFRTWLFSIARNRSIDEMRRQKRHPSLSLDDSPEDDLDYVSVIPDSAPLPEEVVEAAEHAHRVEYLLSLLPEAFQQVLRLIDMEGLDYQQAADVLNLPLGTVKSRLTRGRLKMRQLVQEAVW